MYIVLEIQKNKNGQVAILPYQFADIHQAENKYHTILAYASVSDLPVHTAMIITEYGFVLKCEYYEHEEEPEEEQDEH